MISTTHDDYINELESLGKEDVGNLHTLRVDNAVTNGAMYIEARAFH